MEQLHCTEYGPTKVHDPHAWSQPRTTRTAGLIDVVESINYECPGVTEDSRRVALRFINEQSITAGRIVHFVLTRFDADAEPIIRPALVVRVWGPSMIQLQVFYDGTNDNADRKVDYATGDWRAHYEWVTSVHYDSGEYRKYPHNEYGSRLKEEHVVHYPKHEHRNCMHYDSRTWHWPPRA